METQFRLAFLILLAALLAMRVYFMLKVRRSGGRLLPDKQAVQREGGLAFLILRVVLFVGLLIFLMMYCAGAAWMSTFQFTLPAWVRWAGFGLGITAVTFWTWTQVHLDTRWSAQLQLSKQHRLVTSGPYAFMRHPLYAALIAWCLALILLTANWIFFVICALSAAGVFYRIPKEEQMLIEAFGDEYRAYMNQTGKFWSRL